MSEVCNVCHGWGVYEGPLHIQTQCPNCSGAASRSEQSVGHDDGCGDPTCPHCPADPTAEAVQSPQVGAGTCDVCGETTCAALTLRLEWTRHWRLGYERLRARVEAAEAMLREARLWIVTGIQPPAPQREAFLARRRDSLGRLDDFLGRAQPAAGPSVNPPVASADPELLDLLREARPFVESCTAQQGLSQGMRLLARIDSALSRLAGRKP